MGSYSDIWWPMIFTGISFAVIYGKETLDILDFLISPVSSFPLPQIEMSPIENNLALYHM